MGKMKNAVVLEIYTAFREIEKRQAAEIAVHIADPKTINDYLANILRTEIYEMTTIGKR